MTRTRLMVVGGVVLALMAGYALGRRGGLQVSVSWPSRQATPSTNEPIVILGDFETAEDVARWQHNGVLASPAEEHAVHGSRAMKLIYRGGVEAPLFKLEQWLKSNRRVGNWSGYQFLVFHLYNPQDSQERLILQLKDDEERRYKENVFIGPHQQLEWRVPLADVGGELNLKHMVQFNLFQWTPDHASTCDLDYVHLERGAASAQESQQPAHSTQQAAHSTQHTGHSTQDTAHGTQQTAHGIQHTAQSTQQPVEAAISPNRLGGLRFATEIKRWQRVGASGAAPIVRVPVDVVGPAMPLSVNFPIAGGVPFPMGQLKPGDSIRLSDAGGATWPWQAKPLATWEDGSVKWLLVSTAVPPNAGGRVLSIEYGPPVTPPPAPTVQVLLEETPERVTVTTGVLRFSVNRQRFTFIDEASVDRNQNGVFEPEERIAGGADLVIRHRETDFRSSQDAQTYQLIVEEQGPLRATLKASGSFRDASGKEFCQFIVRIQAFAGLPQVRVFHTFIYTGYPANPFHQEYEGVDLPSNEPIQEIRLELPSVVVARGSRVISADDAGTFTAPLETATTISQTAHNAYRMLEGDDQTRAGVRHEGWFVVQDAQRGVLVHVRDAWQQYPKELVADPDAGRIVVKLWPASAGALSFETGPEAYGPDAVARGSAFGVGKTHELVVGFLGATVDPGTGRALASLWQDPWLLAADPEWLLASNAWGTLGPTRPDRFADGERMLDGLFGWADRQPRDFAWYGMMDYGDTRVWYRREAYDKSYPDWGWHPEGRWGWLNCEAMGTHAGALASFLRTRDPKLFRFAEANTRHVMDVDTVHHNTVARDPRLHGTIGDAFSQVGSMHRHNAYHWGGRNEEATHTNLTGLLMYYYLTGDGRAWDVAHEVGSFLLRDPVTYRRHPDIAPSRALGNVLWGDVLMYQATWDARYLTAAERWVQVLLAGQEPDGSWLETYNPRAKSWTGAFTTRYLTFHVLPGLIAYHRLTGDPAVGRAIVKGTEVLISNELYLQFFDALAYSYFLTGDQRYLDEGLRRVQELVAAQRHVEDPTMNGMVFQKASYERVGPVLYSVPFLFGAVDQPDFTTLEQRFAHSTQHTAHSTQQLAVSPPSTIHHPPSSYDVLIVPSTEKVLPELGAPPAARPNPAQLSLARNEYEAVQLVIRSASTALTQVVVEPGDLTRVAGPGVIPRAAIRWSPVGFVKTKKPDYNVPHVGWWPDPLPAAEPFDVKPNWTQPIWLTVYAASDTPPGDYAGTVIIRPSNAPPTTVRVEVRVWGFALPSVPTLKTAFDVYPNRIQSAYKQFFPHWWQDWNSRPGGLEQLEERLYEDLIRHRLAPILNLEVSTPQETRYLTRLRALGLSAFGIGRFGGTFDNNWPNDPMELAALEPIFRNYAQELRASGLLDGHYLYTYDEPAIGLPKVAEVARMIHTADRELKNLVTLGNSPNVEKTAAWFQDIDIVCLRNVAFDPAQAEALKRLGKELWLYVSGPAPPYPTLVIDYPAMAYRIIPWMCWKYGIKGLLYWCVNYWTTNPYHDPMNTQWGQNGNGSLYYPGPEGPVPSLRLEVLRDGIEDYEYLALLQQLVDRLKFTVGDAQDPSGQELLTRAQRLLAVDPALVESMRSYSRDAQVLEAQRAAVAELIEQLRVRVEGRR